MNLVSFRKATFEKNKLTLSDSISIDEWKELGSQLKQVEGSVQFWIGDWARFGDKKGFTGKYTDSKVYDELEEITGIGRKTLQNYKSISENVDSSRRREDLSFGHHSEVAKLPEEKQTEFLNKASDGKLSVRELRNEIHREDKIFESVSLPEGKFNVIYCDPAWEYSNSNLGGSALNKYPTMSTADICNLEIENLTAENCILFMWVTNPLLEDAFKVIESWGFKYKTNMVWVKDKSTFNQLGFYIYGQHELLLIAVKGSMLPIGDKPKSIITGENKVHSKKPEIVYQIIENMFPQMKYLELFARQKRNGWESWGNELL
jgi:site-specific DNA-methyltransferase (adenine-specific)